MLSKKIKKIIEEIKKINHINHNKKKITTFDFEKNKEIIFEKNKESKNIEHFKNNKTDTTIITIKKILKEIDDTFKNQENNKIILQQTAEIIKKNINLDRIRIYSVDFLKKTISGEFCIGKDLNVKKFKKIRIPFKNDKVIKKVIIEKQSKIFQPYKKDPVAKKVSKKNSDFLSVPIVCYDQTYAMIIADNKFLGEKITLEQLNLVEFISKQVGLILESNITKRKFDKRLKILQNIIDVLKTIKSINSKNEIIDYVMIRFIKLLNPSEISVYFKNEHKNKFTLFTSYLQNQNKKPIKEVDCAINIIKKLIRNKKIIYIKNLQEYNSKNIFLKKENKTLLIIPLIDSDRVEGIIKIKTSKEIELTNEELEILQGIADETSIAIRNSTLLEDMKEKANEEKILNEVNSSINEKTKILDIANVIKKNIEKYDKAEVKIHYNLKENNKNIFQEKEELTTIKKIGNLFYHKNSKNNTKISKVEEIQRDLRFKDLIKKNKIKFDQKNKIIFIPIKSLNKEIILEIKDKKISKNNIIFYNYLFRIVETTLNSKKLYNNLIEKNLELQETNKILDDKIKNFNIIQRLTAQLEDIKKPDKIIETFFKFLKNVYPQEKCCILFRDYSFSSMADKDYDLEFLIDKIKHEKNYGITGQVLNSGKNIVCNNVLNNKKYETIFPETKSQLTLPIKIRNKTSGIITLESPLINRFLDKDQIETLKIIIEQVSISLENSLLLQDLEFKRKILKNKINEMYTISEIIKNIKKTKNIEITLKDVTKSIIQNLGYDIAEIKLYNSKLKTFELKILETKKSINKKDKLNIKKYHNNKFIESKIIQEILENKNNDYFNFNCIKEVDSCLLHKYDEKVFVMYQNNIFYGVLIAGRKNKKINKDSIKFLKDITTQSLIAIKDYRLFKTITNFNKVMKKEVELKTKKLREINNRLIGERNKISNIMNLMADSLVVTDNKNNIILYNETFKKMFGFKEEIKGKLKLILQKYGIDKNFEKKIDLEKDFEHEIYLEKIKKYVLVKKTNLITKNKDVGDIFILQDITTAKMLNKMKDEFVSNVSHELRTPLTSILGYTKLLVSERLGNINEQQKESLNIISKEADRLTRLINEVLDLSKLESGKMHFNYKLNNIRELVQDLKNSFKNLATEKSIKYTIKVNRNVPSTAIFDYDRIKQVFINLINNSFKFTDKNGKIEVVIKSKKGLIICEVKDDGEGIPEDQIKNLFNKFYQVDASMTRRVGGSGLGLAISKDIVEKHNGKIFVRSKLGKGSSFIFYFPIIANKI